MDFFYSQRSMRLVCFLKLWIICIVIINIIVIVIIIITVVCLVVTVQLCSSVPDMFNVKKKKKNLKAGNRLYASSQTQAN